MLDVLDQLGLTVLVISIHGVTAVGAAALLAETGDLTRFNSPRAVVKHAGLCPRDNASGAHQGKTSLSGRGRPDLRLAAWRAVWAAPAQQPRTRGQVPPPHHPTGQPTPATASSSRLRAAALAACRRHPRRCLEAGHRRRRQADARRGLTPEPGDPSRQGRGEPEHPSRNLTLTGLVPRPADCWELVEQVSGLGGDGGFGGDVMLADGDLDRADW